MILNLEQKLDNWSDRRLICGLTVLALFLFCVNLGGVPLRDWDEGTRALVAREIFRSGNWLHPTLAGQPYFNKPPLMDWLMALSYNIGGINEWTSRLPGAIASALGVPLLYCLGRELFAEKSNGKQAALLSALVYLTLMPLVRHGRLAMLDGLILTAMIFSFLCFLKAEKNQAWALGIGIGFGIITFTKGLLVLPIVAIALLFSLRDQRWRIVQNVYFWLGLLYGFLPVMSWYGAQVHYYGQTFINVHFLSQGIDRVADTVENHQRPPWFYLHDILKYSAPWLVFIPQSYILIWQEQLEKHGQLILSGSMFYGFLISAMGTKLPWYIMPFYPFLALAVGYFLSRFEEVEFRRKAFKWPQQFIFYFFVTPALICAFYFYKIEPNIYQRPPQLSLILMSLICALMLATAGWHWQRKNIKIIGILVIGMYSGLSLFFISNAWIWEINNAFPVKPIAEIIRTKTPEDITVLTTFWYQRPSLDFYGDRPVMPASLDERKPGQYWLLHEEAWQDHQGSIGVENLLGTASGFYLVKTNPSD